MSNGAPVSGAHLIDGGVTEQLGEDERPVPEPKDGQLGDDDVGRAARRQGKVHSATIFGSPADDVAVMVTITRRAPTTRSIAPPTPSTSFPERPSSRCRRRSRPAGRRARRRRHVRRGSSRSSGRCRSTRRRGARSPVASPRRSGRGRARPHPVAGRPRAGRSPCAGRRSLVAEQAGDEVRDPDAEVDDLPSSQLLAARDAIRVLTSFVISRAPAGRRTGAACGSTPARGRRWDDLSHLGDCHPRGRRHQRVEVCAVRRYQRLPSSSPRAA